MTTPYADLDQEWPLPSALDPGDGPQGLGGKQVGSAAAILEQKLCTHEVLSSGAWTVSNCAVYPPPRFRARRESALHWPAP